MSYALQRCLVLAVAAAPALAQACATCGCTLSADAAMGYSAAAGWRLNLEYDFIDQNQLRQGYGPASPWQAARLNDRGGSQEVEVKTINRYLNLGINYAPNARWNFAALLPYVSRSHSTYGNAVTGELDSAQISGAHSNGLGDLRLIGSYQGWLPTHNLGAQLGIKLPTGRYGGQNLETGATVGHDPVFFSSGPNFAAHQALDTSLQPGTGSTDLILGAYWYQAVSQDFDAFVNGQFQFALAHALHGVAQDYRPGNQLTFAFGLRYEHDPRWVPQLQINLNHKALDQGALADITDTAGTVVYVSPGITVALRKHLHGYGFVQLPVFSQLDGYQLFPRWTASLGLSYAF